MLEFSSPNPNTRSQGFKASNALVNGLNTIASTIEAKPGAVLFTEGAPANGVYLVRRGQVRASLQAANGEEVLCRIVDTGTLLGVPATMCAKTYQFTAVALTDVEIGFVSAEQLNEFLRTRPEICMQVVGMMSDEILGLREATDQMKTCHRITCLLNSACHEC